MKIANLLPLKVCPSISTTDCKQRRFLLGGLILGYVISNVLPTKVHIFSIVYSSWLQGLLPLAFFVFSITGVCFNAFRKFPCSSLCLSMSSMSFHNIQFHCCFLSAFSDVVSLFIYINFFFRQQLEFSPLKHYFLPLGHSMPLFSLHISSKIFFLLILALHTQYVPCFFDCFLVIYFVFSTVSSTHLLPLFPCYLRLLFSLLIYFTVYLCTFFFHRFIVFFSFTYLLHFSCLFTSDVFIAFLCLLHLCIFTSTVLYIVLSLFSLHTCIPLHLLYCHF